MSTVPDVNQQLAAIAAKARAWAQALAAEEPSRRVRLARPLEGVAMPSAVADILALRKDFSGGAQPKQPWALSLDAFSRQIADCERCSLAGRRRKLVFGEGSSKPPLVFVGDAPGPEEDASGRPFVGAAGDLLDRMLAAMGFKRGDVFLTTLLKCRLPGREPAPAELAACRPYFQQQLRLLQPKAVVSLGATAAAALGGGAKPLSDLRGKWLDLEGLPLMPTFHPSDLLKDPGLKRHVWEDLKLVMKRLHA